MSSVKALVALIPTGLLLAGAAIMFLKGRSLASVLQLLGTVGFLGVVVAHICEAFHVFPWMHWGFENSAGHYLDAASAVLGLTLFPFGYLLHALNKKQF